MLLHMNRFNMNGSIIQVTICGQLGICRANSGFGYSVSIFENTAVVGTEDKKRYIFIVENASNLFTSNEDQKYKSGASGFGNSVRISNDGKKLIIGSKQSYAFIFVRDSILDYFPTGSNPPNDIFTVGKDLNMPAKGITSENGYGKWISIWRKL